MTHQFVHHHHRHPPLWSRYQQDGSPSLTLSHPLTLTASPGSSSLAEVTLRPGNADDLPALLELMDTAIEWLVSLGRTGQWGTEPTSARPNWIKRFAEVVSSDGLWVATAPAPAPAPGPPASDARADGTAEDAATPVTTGTTSTTGPAPTSVVVGALAVGGPKHYISPAAEPERYVRLLITHRSWKGRGLGGLLLAKARSVAREAGVSLLRVDCYAGGDGALVRWYESQGFVRTEAFELEGWPGQVLAMRLD